MPLVLQLLYANEELKTHRDVSVDDVLRAFDRFDWLGETKKADELEKVSPTLTVESAARDCVIWVSSVVEESGVEFVSEVFFPGEVRRFFGLSKKWGTVRLSAGAFAPSDAREALRLFAYGSYDDLRRLYKHA